MLTFASSLHLGQVTRAMRGRAMATMFILS
jgi:hypothetical protein